MTWDGIGTPQRVTARVWGTEQNEYVASCKVCGWQNHKILQSYSQGKAACKAHRKDCKGAKK